MAAMLSAPAVLGAPRVIEETVKIPSPDPEFFFPLSVASDGDWLIATGVRNLDDVSNTQDNSAWLYQRQSNGNWLLVRRLLQYFAPSDLDEPPIKADIQGGVVAILKENASWIFEQSGANWVAVPSPITTDGMDVEINGGTIVVSAGRCTWESNAYRKATNGAWTLVRQTDPQPDEFCENEDDRGDVDVSGNTVMVATYGNELFNAFSARIFEGPYGATPVMTRLVSPAPDNGGFHSPIALELPSALVNRSPEGMLAFTRDASGIWNHTGALVRPDNLRVTGPYDAEIRGSLAVLGYPTDDAHGERTGSVGVYQRNTDGTFRYVARLHASDRGAEQLFGYRVGISGRRVVASSHGGRAAYVFDLPTNLTQPATVQDTFQDGNASDWTPQPGSSFTVATTSNSRVYRQSSTVGNAASIWNNTDRTNQAVEADIKPTAFATTAGDKWLGLVTRYIDANNYYYVTLRNNNTVLLRRMVNGVFTTLGSAPLTMTLNRNYRVRLEAIGTRLRLFVDNRLLAEATDNTLTHGQAGVMMYKMRADYDNIVVSGNPHTTLAQYGFAGLNDSYPSWETLGAWTQANGVYAQSDLTSGTRAITGIATDDQIVHARMRRTSAAGTNNWFGLATRYRDAGNHYYITIRNDNTIALRKLVNNGIVELDTAAFTAATNVWYRVRFEAIGTQLRVYINDVLQLEAADSSHASGRYGPVLYRTAAQYDDIVAVQP